jgi:predicted Zn-dependent peptidase
MRPATVARTRGRWSPAARGGSPRWRRLATTNGMVIAVEVGGTGPPAYCVRYAVGSRDDPSHAAGLAHLVEHLMFENGRPGGWHRAVDELGGFWNGGTTADATSFFAVFPCGGIDDALGFEAERMSRLLAGDDGLEREKQVVAAEAAFRRAEPEFAVREAVAAAAFGGSGYGSSRLGSAAALARVRLADAAVFHRRHYAPANAVIALAGELDTAAVAARALGAFGMLPRRPRPVRAAAAPFRPGRGSCAAGAAAVAWPLPGLRSRALERLLLTCDVLAERASGEGWRQAVELHDAGGLFVLWRPAPGAAAALAAALATPPRRRELAQARALEQLGDARELEDSRERAELVAQLVAAGRHELRQRHRWDVADGEVRDAWDRLVRLPRLELSAG